MKRVSWIALGVAAFVGGVALGARERVSLACKCAEAHWELKLAKASDPTDLAPFAHGPALFPTTFVYGDGGMTLTLEASR